VAVNWPSWPIAPARPGYSAPPLMAVRPGRTARPVDSGRHSHFRAWPVQAIHPARAPGSAPLRGSLASGPHGRVRFGGTSVIPSKLDWPSRPIAPVRPGYSAPPLMAVRPGRTARTSLLLPFWLPDFGRTARPALSFPLLSWTITTNGRSDLDHLPGGSIEPNDWAGLVLCGVVRVNLLTQAEVPVPPYSCFGCREQPKSAQGWPERPLEGGRGTEATERVRL